MLKKSFTLDVSDLNRVSPVFAVVWEEDTETKGSFHNIYRSRLGSVDYSAPNATDCFECLTASILFGALTGATASSHHPELHSDLRTIIGKHAMFDEGGVLPRR